jgi:hypothetical protein
MKTAQNPRGAGRKRKLKNPVAATYYIEQEEKVWIENEAKKRKLANPSEFVRDVIRSMIEAG